MYARRLSSQYEIRNEKNSDECLHLSNLRVR